MTVLTMAIVIVGPIHAAEEQFSTPSQTSTDKKISNTRIASCLVKVTADPVVMRINSSTIEYLLYSSGVAGRALRDVLGVSLPEDLSELFGIEELDSSHDTGGFGLPVSVSKQWPSGLNDAYRPAFPGSDLMVMDDYEYQMRKEQMDPNSGSSSAAARPRSRAAYSNRMPSHPSEPFISVVEDSVLFKLDVLLSEDYDPVAEEFMNVLLVNFEKALWNAFDTEHTRLSDRSSNAATEVDNAEAYFEEQQRVIRTLSDGRELERTQILRKISQLRQLLDSSEMELASNQATAEATVEQITKTRSKLTGTLQDDPITSELLRLLEFQNAAIENAKRQYELGKGSSQALINTKEKLAKTKIELARRQQELGRSTGSELIDTLSQELANLAISEARIKAGIVRLREQIEKTGKLLSDADRYELLALKADIAKLNLEEAILWHKQIERRVRLIQAPSVSVIGAN